MDVWANREFEAWSHGDDAPPGCSQLLRKHSEERNLWDGEETQNETGCAPTGVQDCFCAGESL